MARTDVPRRLLLTVLLLNLGMGGIEMAGSIVAGSTALMADAVDFLIDAFTYGVTLYVLNRSARAQRRAAIGKALLMAGLGIGVLAVAIWRFFGGVTPEPVIMGSVALAAFGVNLFCAVLLYRFRSASSNLRSVWLCSRNDVAINLLVFGAALLVAATASPWPDLGVALFIVLLEGQSAVSILRQVRSEREDYGAIISQCSKGGCEDD